MLATYIGSKRRTLGIWEEVGCYWEHMRNTLGTKKSSSPPPKKIKENWVYLVHAASRIIWTVLLLGTKMARWAY
jgi:hypothetical protein